MKIALCLSGHTRNHDRTYVYWYENLLSKHDVDVFIHTWDDKGNKINPSSGMDFSTAGVDTITKVDVDRLTKLWNPITYVVESYANLHPVFLKDIQPLMDAMTKYEYMNHSLFMPMSARSMMYKRKQCNALKSAYEKKMGFKYDFVIQSRFDVVLLEQLSPIITGDPTRLYLNDSGGSDINDYTTMGSSISVDYWCSYFDFFTTMLNKDISSVEQLDLMLNHHKYYHEFIAAGNISYSRLAFNVHVLRKDSISEHHQSQINDFLMKWLYS